MVTQKTLWFKYKSKQLKLTATMQDLFTKARRQIVTFELRPSNDWSRDAFNVVSSSLPEILVGAQTELTQQ